MVKTKNATHKFFEGRRLHVTKLGEFPGVTTVLSATANKYGLEKWKATVGEVEANRISNESRSFGDRVHKNIENIITGEVVTDSVATPLLDFVRGLDSVVACEYAVSHPAGFAGSIDAIAVIDNVLTVVDWKTSRKKKFKSGIKDYFLQAAAYRAAYEFETRESIRAGLICVYNRADNELQKFPMSQDDLCRAWGDFQRRLNAYYDLYPTDF